MSSIDEHLLDIQGSSCILTYFVDLISKCRVWYAWIDYTTLKVEHSALFACFPYLL